MPDDPGVAGCLRVDGGPRRDRSGFDGETRTDPCLETAVEEAGRSGVAAIGVAQEYQNVFAATRREDRGRTGNQVWYSFYKADRRVTCFYFYLWDADFGPAFIKVCAYFPYPIKVWLNGHEWAKRQAAHDGVAPTEARASLPAITAMATCIQALCILTFSSTMINAVLWIKYKL